MFLPDVNVLVYAFDEASLQHDPCLKWLEEMLNGDIHFGLPEPVWSGFLRITTNPKLSLGKVSFEKLVAFLETLRNSTNHRMILPSDRHWQIFLRLCREIKAQANDIPDVYLAALAIESHSELVSTDRGFTRFSGLKWFNPLD